MSPHRVHENHMSRHRHRQTPTARPNKLKKHPIFASIWFFFSFGTEEDCDAILTLLALDTAIVGECVSHAAYPDTLSPVFVRTKRISNWRFHFLELFNDLIFENICCRMLLTILLAPSPCICSSTQHFLSKPQVRNNSNTLFFLCHSTISLLATSTLGPPSIISSLSSFITPLVIRLLLVCAALVC